MPRSYDEIVAHYERAREEARLEEGAGRLEWARTLELFERHLPKPPARLLDAGAGPGAYACWLARAGYEVHVLDLVPAHVERARQRSEAQPDHPCASFTVGDARALDFPDERFDGVLLLGPLYHLQEREERLLALREARRVCRPGGVVLVACISRLASTLDALRLEVLRDDGYRAMVRDHLATGRHANPTGRADLFTTSYFHTPEELAGELAEAGLVHERTVGVEGPAWFLPDLDQRWASAERRQDVLAAARELEREPSAAALSAHLLAVARR